MRERHVPSRHSAVAAGDAGRDDYWKLVILSAPKDLCICSELGELEMNCRDPSLRSG